MKKNSLRFIALLAAAAAAAAVFGAMLIYRADRQEIYRTENIAGAVITAYPETEETFMKAVMDTDQTSAAAGEKITAHYGYDGEMPMKSGNKNNLIIYIAICAAMFCLSAAAVYRAVSSGARMRREQEKRITEILEQCIEGDYSFAGDGKMPDCFEDRHFADALVKLAENLALKTERLNEERDSTKTLVTDISHQLKTPVSAMKACFDMCRDAQSDAERQEFLEMGRAQVDKLENLSAALINISRLEKQMIELHREDIMLTDILIDAANTVYYKAAAADIELVTAEFDDVRLCLDRKWTAEALANILDNGIKYSRPGSAIHIRVQKLFSFVRIEIEDEGIGIPKDERNLIFRRFYRGRSEAVKAQDGSGIGLYLSRKILEDQGGTVSVRAGHENGSIFIIQLPL